MDPLSITASIIAILQVTTKVGFCLRDAKDASADCSHFIVETTNLSSLLVTLLSRIEEDSSDPWHVQAKELGGRNGAIYQYRVALEQLKDKVTVGHSLRKPSKLLLWKYVRDDAERLLARIERLKSLVQIALGMDHFALSRANHSTLSSIDGSNQIIQAGVFNLQTHQDDLQHLAIMDWLSTDDFSAQQLDHIQRRQEGTGVWFLSAPEFEDWSQASRSILFCTGIPGAGKTMIAAITVDHLQKQIQTPDVGIAYLYCSYKRQEQQTVSRLLAAMLRQLVQDNPPIAKPALDLHKAHVIRRTRPPVDDIFGALRTVVGSYKQTYLVIDALDECSDENTDRTKLLNSCFTLQQQKGVHLMFTSRHISDIVNRFKSVPPLEIRADPTDVKCYIKGQVGRLPKCIQRDLDLQDRIQNEITDAADGMFLLARLHVDSLLDKRTKAKVLQTLNNLTKGTKALEDAYHEATIRIDSQLPEDRTLAKNVLSWISYARRPLMGKELCHALAVELEDEELNSDNILEIDDIVPVCAGLVLVDEESQIIRLVHYTTQEYLETIRETWDPEARYRIAATCLTYLCFRPFQSGACGCDAEFETRLAQNPFLEYAARHWGIHTANVQEQACEIAMYMLQHKEVVACLAQTSETSESHRFRSEGYSQCYPKNITGLHLSAALGLQHLSEELHHRAREDIEFANLKSDRGQTALYLAVREGHLDVSRWLVGKDHVDLNCADNISSSTPLMLATRKNRSDIVEVLLDSGKVNVDQRDSEGTAALQQAASRGHDGIVKLLLAASNIDVDIRDHSSSGPWKSDFRRRTALIAAADGGHVEVVRLLLGHSKVDLNARSIGGGTALTHAAFNGHLAVLKLLLDTGRVDINASDGKGMTALMEATMKQHGGVVKLLLETPRIEINASRNDGMTALMWASVKEELEILKLLLNTDNIEVNMRDDDGRTALCWAIRCGRHEAVNALLAHKAIEVIHDQTMKMALRDAAKWWKDKAIVDVVYSYLNSHKASI